MMNNITQRNMTSIYLCSNDKILLLYRQGSKVANEMWIGTAGGHFEENELNDATACVLRELNEEIGLQEDTLRNLALRYVTLRQTKGEIRVNYYFFAMLDNGEDLQLTSNEGILKWFTLDEVNDLKMPFTAEYVMKHYVSIGQFNNLIYGGIATDSSVLFSELSDF